MLQHIALQLQHVIQNTHFGRSIMQHGILMEGRIYGKFIVQSYLLRQPCGHKIHHTVGVRIKAFEMHMLSRQKGNRGGCFRPIMYIVHRSARIATTHQNKGEVFRLLEI